MFVNFAKDQSDDGQLREVYVNAAMEPVQPTQGMQMEVRPKEATPNGAMQGPSASSKPKPQPRRQQQHKPKKGSVASGVPHTAENSGSKDPLTLFLVDGGTQETKL